MRDMARLQEAFQHAIMTGDDAVLSEIRDSPRENRQVLFGVYRNAYVQRLVEILSGEFPTLLAHMGEDDFDEAARAYVAAHPSRHRNARWIGVDIPGFLAGTEPFSARPELAEIAALECALSDAFDAADAPVLAITDLGTIPPEAWNGLRLTAQPSARRLDLSSNALAIWSAIVDDEPSPVAETLDAPERVIVWRNDATPRVRAMPVEEAMLWDEAARGHTFGLLCQMAATYDDPDNAAARAAGCLVGWINAGMLAGAEVEDQAPEARPPA
jgi:hypothetical protein